MPGRYVEDLAGDMSEKGGDLRRCDLPSHTYGGVMIDCRGVATGCTQAPCAVDNVQTGLCGAHPVAAGSALVSEGLTVFIVFLLAKAYVKAMSASVTMERSWTRQPMEEEKVKSSTITGNAIGRSPQFGSLIMVKE